MAATQPTTGKLITPGPIAFIQYPREEDAEDQDIKLTNEARELLTKLNKPLKIIGIIGSYRGGKSFILNQLLGVQKGFDLGHEVEGKTRDIWLWGVDRGDHIVLAVDTEGLNDISNRDEELDAKIFTVSLLISSYLIYNVMQKIDEEAIQRLGLVTQLIKHMKTSLREGVDFREHLPPLMWLVRDFSLQLKEGESSDRWLIRALEERKGNNSAAKKSNEIRKAINTYFPKLECVCLPTPVLDMSTQLALMEHDPSVLRPSFLEKSSKLIQKLHDEAPLKEITMGGKALQLEGPNFVVFIDGCLKALNGDMAFNIPDSFKAIAREQCEAALREAELFYNSEMLKTKLPLEVNTLHKIHNELVNHAAQLVTSKAIGDAKDECLDRLMAILQQYNENKELVGGLFFTYSTKNSAASEEFCKNLHVKLSKNLEDVSKFASMSAFKQAQQKLLSDYDAQAIGPAKLLVREQIFKGAETKATELATKLKLSQLEVQSMHHKSLLEASQRAIENEKIRVQQARREAEQLQNQAVHNIQVLQQSHQNEKVAWQRRLEAHQQEINQRLIVVRQENQQLMQEAIERHRQRMEAEYERRRREQEAAERRRQQQIEQQQMMYATVNAINSMVSSFCNF